MFFHCFSDGQREDENVNKLLDALKPLTNKILILDDKQVRWFPRHINELDLIANRTLDAGVDLESDHPGFKDEAYRARRGKLAKMAQDHSCMEPIPFINYTPEETATWTAVWDQMEPLWEKYACEEYKVCIEERDCVRSIAGYVYACLCFYQHISSTSVQ